MSGRSIPFVKNIAGDVQPDGSAIRLVVTTKDGVEHAMAFLPRDASKFLWCVIDLAQKAGEKSAAPTPETGPLVAYPIAVSALGVVQGATQEDAILSIQFGHMSLEFSVPLELLMKQLKEIQAVTVKIPLRKPN